MAEKKANTNVSTFSEIETKKVKCSFSSGYCAKIQNKKSKQTKCQARRITFRKDRKECQAPS